MKQISVAIWYNEADDFKIDDLQALKMTLGVDVIITTHPSNKLEDTQYPYLVIKTFEIPNK